MGNKLLEEKLLKQTQRKENKNMTGRKQTMSQPLDAGLMTTDYTLKKGLQAAEWPFVELSQKGRAR